MNKELIVEMLQSLKQEHYNCGDPYYSCPKAQNGDMCNDPNDPCDCNADWTNNKIDEIIRLVLST